MATARFAHLVKGTAAAAGTSKPSRLRAIRSAGKSMKKRMSPKTRGADRLPSFAHLGRLSFDSAGLHAASWDHAFAKTAGTPKRASGPIAKSWDRALKRT